MSEPGSITMWLDRLKDEGDRDEAVARLWERYFTILVMEARKYLRGRRALSDGEDVALCAFDRFVRAVEAGKFPRLSDRHDLWRVLLLTARNLARNAVRDENRDKRGGGRSIQTIVAADLNSGGTIMPAAEPDPADVVAVAESADRLLAALGDPELRQVAQQAMSGHTNMEIAAIIGKEVATVERKLKRIREIWAEMGYG